MFLPSIPTLEESYKWTRPDPARDGRTAQFQPEISAQPALPPMISRVVRKAERSYNG